MRLANAETEKTKFQDKIRSLEKHITSLIKEKDVEIPNLSTQKARLERQVAAMEKSIDQVITLNYFMQLELDFLNDNRLHGWKVEKKLVREAGFKEWCYGFITNDPKYTFSIFDEETKKWVNESKVKEVDFVKDKRIALGLEEAEEDASLIPL